MSLGSSALGPLGLPALPLFPDCTTEDVDADMVAYWDKIPRAVCARPAPVLSLSWPCDLQSSDVLSWARSVSASEVAARGLALHKCHSVHSVSIAPILRLTPRLLTLVITSQRLGTDGMEAVGRARHASLSRSRVCRSEVFADAHMPTRLPGG